MHGREHVIILRAGNKGLIGHTMFYVNEVRRENEYATDISGVVAKELDLAKKYLEALAESFQPQEFTDIYREQLQSLIASKEPRRSAAKRDRPKPAASKVVDIMDALRKSLEVAKATSARRKPAVSEDAARSKPRKRKA